MNSQYRYFVIAISHVTVMFYQMLLNTFNIAINSMIKRVPTENMLVSLTNCSGQSCYTLGIQAQGEFEWTELQKGLVLGLNYVGCIMPMFGALSDLYGTKRVIGISLLLDAILTILTPTISRASFYLLIAARILQSCIEAPVLPGFSSLLSKWFPAKEKTR